MRTHCFDIKTTFFDMICNLNTRLDKLVIIYTK